MLPIYTINALMDLMTGQDQPGVEERGGGRGHAPPPEVRLGGQSIFWPPRIFKEMKKIFLNSSLFQGNPLAHPD